MNDEQRVDQTLRDFYIDDQSHMHDRNALLRDVLDAVHETPQQRRRRWWPFRRHAALTSTLPTRELQPELSTTTTNGQTAASGGGVPAVVSAMRLAIAAVVIALFGGFLLFSVLTPQSPAVLPGASSPASPRLSPAPTEDPVNLTTPAATVLAAAATLLPATGLAESEPGFVAEQVEPGVERIVSDGAGFDMRTLDGGVLYAFHDIATSDDGDVWVVAYRYHTNTGRVEGPFAWELGSVGEYGSREGLPVPLSKIVVDADGTPTAAGSDGIRVFDGSAWVDSPGTRSVDTGGGIVAFIEPGDIPALGPEGAAGVLALAADQAGYTLDEAVGRRYMRDWPSWWLACSAAGGDAMSTGCVDGRGIGVGHNDGNEALFLADTIIGRFARSDEGAIWVLAGPTIEDLWSGRSTEGGAIYRIDPETPGHRCLGCY